MLPRRRELTSREGGARQLATPRRGWRVDSRRLGGAGVSTRDASAGLACRLATPRRGWRVDSRRLGGSGVSTRDASAVLARQVATPRRQPASFFAAACTAATIGSLPGG